jgi:hypothetical protein
MERILIRNDDEYNRYLKNSRGIAKYKLVGYGQFFYGIVDRRKNYWLNPLLLLVGAIGSICGWQSSL